MRSLRLRLFSFGLALAAAVAAAVGGATYVSVRAQADELFDYHLQQMALSLRDQGRVADSERAALANPALDYVVQIWSIEGVVLYSSLPPGQTQPLPARAVLGFSDAQVGGSTWRIYAAAMPLRVVQVGQPLDVRRRLAAAAAWRSVGPIAVAAPLVALALWWLAGLSLAPLGRVAAAARTRNADALEPLPANGLPSEVQPLVDAFNGLLQRLAAAFASQRTFVADAAHELRTPLTALNLQLGLLRDTPDGPDREAALARLRGGIARASRLVEQLLALARAEPGGTPALADVDLAAVARQAVADAAPLASQRGARIDVQAPQSLPVRGDADGLRSLLRNLVDNAVKYGGATPDVRVTLSSQPGHALVHVDDHGPGIPADERERVFDRFHRREGSGGKGSGLGLAIVRALARQHGGDVSLHDAPGGGLRVQVRLPLAGPVQAPPVRDAQPQGR